MWFLIWDELLQVKFKNLVFNINWICYCILLMADILETLKCFCVLQLFWRCAVAFCSNCLLCRTCRTIQQTPWTKALLEMEVVPQLLEQFPSFCGTNPQFIIVVTTACQFVPVLSQISPVHPISLRSILLFFRCSHPNPACISLLHHVCHMLPTSYSSVTILLYVRIINHAAPYYTFLSSLLKLPSS